MKVKIYNVLGSIFYLTALVACDVDRIPETQITDPSFWKSEADLKSATNYLYTFLPGFGEEESWSDNTYGLQAHPVSDGTQLPPATSAYFSEPYSWIRAANNVIEKSDRVEITDAVREVYVAEARFFRAFAYFQLLQKYGGVPLIIKTLTEVSPELKEPAKPREDVVSQIYQDLDFAVGKLPKPSALGAAYGRVTNIAALAMKARVALFEGTRAKFHGYGDPSYHLNLAVSSSKEIIDAGENSLFDNYFNLFQYQGEGPQNKENILVKQYGLVTGNVVLSHNYSATQLFSGRVNPTKSLVDSYLMKDGLPIEKSPFYQKPVVSLDVFTDRDLRLSASVFKRGDPYEKTTTYGSPPLQFHKTGFGPRKYWNAEDYITRQAMIDWVIIRYSEVLLTFAEATFELNGRISDADLDMSINLLRKRGEVAPLTNSFAELYGLDMREEIRRERRVELAQENHRYWDLLRWKTAETELPKAVLGNYLFEEFGTDIPVNTNENGFIVVQDASFRRFDPQKDYLWPFPVNELGLNPALKQNNGW